MFPIRAVIASLLMLGASALRQSVAAQTTGNGAAGNGAADRPLAVTLSKRFSVGGAEDSRFTPNYIFATGIAVDARSRLYVLDNSQQRIIVYGPQGQWIGTRGRQGAGPGEMKDAGAVGVGFNGDLFVAEASKRAMVRFDSAGKVLPEVPNNGFRYVQHILAALPKEMLLYVSKADTDLVVRRTDAAVVRLVTVTRPASKQVPAWDACGLRGQSSSPLLSPSLLTASNGTDVVINTGGAYAIQLIRPGKPVSTISRAVRETRATTKDAQRLLGDSLLMFIGKRPCAVPTALVAAQAGVASVVPAYQSLAVDRANRVWAVRTAAEKATTTVDVFDMSRGYLGTATLGHAKPIAFLADGGLVSLERDSDDAPVIVVYNITVGR